MDWLVRTFIYPIFFGLDCVVYGLIQSVYNLFFQLSNVSILADTTIESFAQRIYVIVGVFMMFKVAISLITMMVSPDKIQSGGGKLVQRIVISLVLLVVAPNIFTLAYRIQSYIIRDNVLGNLILGASSASDADLEASYEDGGQTISVQVFKGFFHPVNSSIEVKTPDQCSGETGDDPACIYATADSVDDFGDIIASHDYDYSFVISSIAGAYVAWMLVMYCFDIAVRAVKLAFLQLIAPVPILAYIDESKGNNVFNNWLKQCTSSFLSLFIRLITIYFVIFIISEIVRQNGLGYYMFDADTQQYVYSSVGSNWLLGAFIIIGLLLFARQVPKLIEDVTGIQSEKAFSSNGTSAFLGALGGSLVGGAANLGANLFGRHQFKQKYMNEDGTWKDAKYAEQYREKFGGMRPLTSTLGGMGSGFFRSGKFGMSGKSPMDAIRAGRIATTNAREDRALGYGWKEKMANFVSSTTGAKINSGESNVRQGRLNELADLIGNVERDERSASQAFEGRINSLNGYQSKSMRDYYNSLSEGEDGVYQNYLAELAKSTKDQRGYSYLTDADLQGLNVKQRERVIQDAANRMQQDGVQGIVQESGFVGIETQRQEVRRLQARSKELKDEREKLEKSQGAGKHDN